MTSKGEGVVSLGEELPPGVVEPLVEVIVDGVVGVAAGPLGDVLPLGVLGLEDVEPLGEVEPFDVLVFFGATFFAAPFLCGAFLGGVELAAFLAAFFVAFFGVVAFLVGLVLTAIKDFFWREQLMGSCQEEYNDQSWL